MSCSQPFLTTKSAHCQLIGLWISWYSFTLISTSKAPTRLTQGNLPHIEGLGSVKQCFSKTLWRFDAKVRRAPPEQWQENGSPDAKISQQLHVNLRVKLREVNVLLKYVEVISTAYFNRVGHCPWDIPHISHEKPGQQSPRVSFCLEQELNGNGWRIMNN